MKTFDEEYGDGSLEELREELSLPDFEVAEIAEQEVEAEAARFVRVQFTGEGRAGIVQFLFNDPEVWMYTSYMMSPEGQELYTRTSERFSEAAIKRGVGQFEAPNPAPAARAALEASGWDFDDRGRASVEPEVLAEYGRSTP